MEMNAMWFTILLTVLSIFQFGVMVFLVVLIIGLYRRISVLDDSNKTNVILNHKMLTVTRIMFKTLIRYENNLKRWYNQSTGLQWVVDNDTNKDYQSIVSALAAVTKLMHNPDMADKINTETTNYLYTQGRDNPGTVPIVAPPVNIPLEKR